MTTAKRVDPELGKFQEGKCWGRERQGGGSGHMRMNFGRNLVIQDLGKHSALTVISLGILLAGTVNVTPDPKRKGFYEVQGGSTVYYICALPVTGTICLLATWSVVQPLVERLEVAVQLSPTVAEPELSTI